jgi:cell wall-associated NlpC family hydrolase
MRVEAAALAQAPTRPRARPMRRALIRAAVPACAVASAAVAAIAASGCGEAGTRQATAAGPSAQATPATRPDANAHESLPPLKPHPQVVRAVRPGDGPPSGVTAGNGTENSSNTAPPTDAQVRNELAAFRRHLAGVGAARGPIAEVRPDGTAVVPLDAPEVVARVVAAGNAIATTPYKWGGGHGGWKDTGYDCSGSVSFALAGAGLLQSPLTSGAFMHWGAPGRGRWITILANGGHAFMVVAGLRFDTSGAQGGTRWQPANGRSYAGFAVRHPPGL